MYHSLSRLVGLILCLVQSAAWSQTTDTGSLAWEPCDTSISLTSKIIGNKGEGDMSLTGVRNLRPVLKGILYRSGANNVYSSFLSRPNDSPLSFQTLVNLRASGFWKAIYLYSSRFEDNLWPQMQPALDAIGMQYVSMVPKNDSLAHIIMQDIALSIQNPEKGAVLVHCWNGWHMSGLVSAYALMQFCDFTPAQAWSYWRSCTDGNDKGFSKLRERIFAFKSSDSLKLTYDQKQKICPCAAL